MSSDQGIPQDLPPVTPKPPVEGQEPMERSWLDKIQRFINIAEFISRIAHVILKGIKEAIIEYKRDMVPVQQPPTTEIAIRQLAPTDSGQPPR